MLMTTATLIAAMAPMTGATGPGAGGQALSLVVTLLIVPVAWFVFDDLRRALERRSAPP